MWNLKDKVVIISGATNGIGKAAALEILKEKYEALKEMHNDFKGEKKSVDKELVELYAEMEKKGWSKDKIEEFDKVKKFYRDYAGSEEVKKLESEGRKIIIVGDHGHDEVVGIASQVKDPIIVGTPKEAKALRKTKRAGVVSQSTQTIENVQEIINIIMTKVFDLRFVNTICFPTKRNQIQIKELAKQCDVMIVIGSFTSANSKRLTALAKARNKNSYQVTCADEIQTDWLAGAEVVGLSAGASTPDNIIDEVLAKIKEIGNVPEEMVYG